MDLIPELGEFKTDFEFKQRFKLLSFSDVFSSTSYEWMRQSFSSLDWKKNESHFYQQFSSKITPKMNHPLQNLYHEAFFSPFRSKLESLLHVRLRDSFSLVAHKLVTSQEIGVHNDYCDPEFGYENFRFVFQFNELNQPKKGGELSFLYSEDKQNVIRTYNYSSNQGICFEISPYSYHCVAPIDGERYTLVMYLWDRDKKYDGSGFEVIHGT